MAIDLTVQYPGKVGAATAQFPYGIPQNITAPGDGTGTPWEAAIVKDTEGLKQALLKSSGIVPSGTPDEVGASEYLQSIVEIAAGRGINYDESGAVNAYVLDVRTGQQGPASYYDGFIAEFEPGVTNTGPATANVAGLGIKSIKTPTGAALTGGELVTGNRYKLRYDGVNLIVPIQVGSRVLLASKSAAADATIEFIDVLDNAYYEYELEYYHVDITAGSGGIWLEFSTNSGGLWTAKLVDLSHPSNMLPGNTLVEGHCNMFSASEAFFTKAMVKQFTGVVLTEYDAGNGVTDIYDSLRVVISSSTMATGEFRLYGKNPR